MIKSERDTRGSSERVCDASREAHRADRAGIRAFRAAARANARDFNRERIPSRRSQGRANIDSKFVRT